MMAIRWQLGVKICRVQKIRNFLEIQTFKGSQLRIQTFVESKPLKTFIQPFENLKTFQTSKFFKGAMMDQFVIHKTHCLEDDHRLRSLF